MLSLLNFLTFKYIQLFGHLQTIIQPTMKTGLYIQFYSIFHAWSSIAKQFTAYLQIFRICKNCNFPATIWLHIAPYNLIATLNQQDLTGRYNLFL